MKIYCFAKQTTRKFDRFLTKITITRTYHGRNRKIYRTHHRLTDIRFCTITPVSSSLEQNTNTHTYLQTSKTLLFLAEESSICRFCHRLNVFDIISLLFFKHIVSVNNIFYEPIFRRYSRSLLPFRSIRNRSRNIVPVLQTGHVT